MKNETEADRFDAIEQEQHNLRESIARSKELARRSQEILDDHRRKHANTDDDDSGQAA
ncbi:MAG TPA: hypothetical protein VE567_06695 [Sphingomonas sp.]|nr:hypothetical protein [Sphingomonas sp.]